MSSAGSGADPDEEEIEGGHAIMAVLTDHDDLDDLADTPGRLLALREEGDLDVPDESIALTFQMLHEAYAEAEAEEFGATRPVIEEAMWEQLALGEQASVLSHRYRNLRSEWNAGRDERDAGHDAEATGNRTRGRRGNGQGHSRFRRSGNNVNRLRRRGRRGDRGRGQGRGREDE